VHPLLLDGPAEAVRRLRAGGLVVLPTETVYGLAARAGDEAAVARIFTVKGRPADHPLIVHLADAALLDDGWAVDIGEEARVLAATCWPGPLTLLLHRGPRVHDVVCGGRDTVGIRIPAHPLTLQVLRELDDGVAAPSANLFGRVSPTTVAHVLEDLGEVLDPACDGVLDGGPAPVGVESTIVDCTVRPVQVLRPGGIPVEDVETLLATAVAPASGPRRASGMLASHYAPTAAVHLVESRPLAEERRSELVAAGRKVDILDLTDDPARYAAELYERLRAADRAGLDDLVAVLPPPRGLGHAVRDRLSRAAADRDRPTTAG
jgi:L-threonylcarbamoyladenylate synthase